MKFGYQSEKFLVARSCLMLPHPRGEAESIACAFHACSLGLYDLRREELDDNARAWAAKIEELMDTTGLEDPSGRGTWKIKAEQLTMDQKHELSRSIDELANWFHRECWSNG